MSAATVPVPPRLEDTFRRVMAAPPGEAPSLRADGTYARIREALREDDASLPRGIWERPLKRAEPAAAAAAALEALERAGDLYVAGWLLEAWVRMHGFAGAADGLRVVHALSAERWDALHPPPGPEDRDRAFEWMAEQLAGWLARVPLAAPQGAGGEAAAFTWSEWKAALYRARRPGNEKAAGGEATVESLREAAQRTPTPFYAAALGELGECQGVLDALQALLAERCGGAPPSFAAARRTLEELRAWVASVLGKRPGEEPDPEPEPAALPEAEYACEPEAGEPDGEAPHPHPPAPGRPPRFTSRAEAYRALEAAAAYLERAEPHSPAPHLVRRAIAWGSMSLGELLEELLKDGYDLKSLRALLGLAGDGGGR